MVLQVGCTAGPGCATCSILETGSGEGPHLNHLQRRVYDCNHQNKERLVLVARTNQCLLYGNKDGNTAGLLPEPVKAQMPQLCQSISFSLGNSSLGDGPVIQGKIRIDP